MERRRSREEVAESLRGEPPPAPTDDTFVAVLANLAAASAPTLGEHPMLTKRLTFRAAAAAAAIVLVSVGGAYAAGQITRDDPPAPTPAPVSPATPAADDTNEPEPVEPAETDEPSPTPEANDQGENADEQGGDVNEDQADDQGENADDQGENVNEDQGEDSAQPSDNDSSDTGATSDGGSDDGGSGDD